MKLLTVLPLTQPHRRPLRPLHPLPLHSLIRLYLYSITVSTLNKSRR
jgi:hypothetical protein